MTCHEARELYSALLDAALDAGERGAVEAHVAGCPECARELERFRRTVSLIRDAAPARAPVGFVDRVLAAARPTPWYRRLGRRLFRPLAVKLPLEAAALLLVGGAAVYVFQHTPELQKAARPEVWRPELSAPATPSPVPAPSAPAPSGSGAGRSNLVKRDAATHFALPSRAAERGDERPSAPSANAQAPDASGPGATRSYREGGDPTGVAAKKEADAERHAKRAKSVPEGAAGRVAEPAAPQRSAANRGQAAGEQSRDRVLPSVLSDAAPPSQPTSEMREERQPAPPMPPPAAVSPPAALRKAPAAAETGATRPSAPPAAPGASQAPVGPLDSGLQAAPGARQDAARQSTRQPAGEPADVAARLAVADHEVALRAIADLLDRAGGREVSRRPEGDAATIDVLVPRERYADFLRALAQLGRLSLEREPDTLPGLVRVALRIGG